MTFIFDMRSKNWKDKFCYKCGKQLIYKKEINKRFNIETGEYEYDLEVACPDKRFWNDHLSTEVDVDGYEIIPRYP